MGLVAARCTNCGGDIKVDDSKEAGICEFCGTAFITEKVIHNITNIVNNNFEGANVTVNNGYDEEKLKALADNALKMEIYSDALKYYTQLWEMKPENTDYILNKLYCEYAVINATKEDPVKVNKAAKNFCRYVHKCIEIIHNIIDSDVNDKDEILIFNIKTMLRRFVEYEINFFNKRLRDVKTRETEEIEYDEFKRLFKYILNNEKLNNCKKFICELQLSATDDKALDISESYKKFKSLDCLDLIGINQTSDTKFSFSRLSQERYFGFIDVHGYKDYDGLILATKYYNSIDSSVEIWNESMTNTYEAKLQKKRDENITKEKQKEGCYVATAVYGSYDCPEVWTLRRFRDYKLAETWYGRAFIYTYYSISPTLVKWFGNTNWFKNMWKGKLDRMVNNLQKEGFESTPYQDKNWR